MGELMDRQGGPDHIRSDNGPEFVVQIRAQLDRALSGRKIHEVSKAG